MLKITRSLIAWISLVLIVISCGNKSSSADPKTVLVEFFTLLSKKDIDGASKLATQESQFTLNMMKTALERNKDVNGDDPAEEFKDAEFGEARISGETALVPVTNKKKRDQMVEFPLKKESGEWKVDFSMASLMKMGQDARSKQGLDGMDESGEDVSPEDIKRSMEMMDSVMKNMDPKKREEMKKLIEKYKDSATKN